MFTEKFQKAVDKGWAVILFLARVFAFVSLIRLMVIDGGCELTLEDDPAELRSVIMLLFVVLIDAELFRIKNMVTKNKS